MTPIRFLLCLLLAEGVSCAGTLKQLGQFKVPHAAFVEIVEDHHATHPQDKYSVWVAAFNPVPFATDHVYEVTAIGRKLGDLSHQHTIDVTHAITWPNEIQQVPESVFHKDIVAAPGGFLVPLKTHGTIGLFDLSVSPPKGPYTITSSADASWFYHRVMWMDMNGDGRLDAVTCRAKKPIFGSAQGELVWFEHPASGEFAHPWKMHLLAHGPDAYFTITKMSAGGKTYDVILTAGFFSKTLNVYWTTDPSGHWTDASKVKTHVIDHSFGPVFDVEVVDLNGDGKQDLMVTGNNAKAAFLYGFEIPSDFRTGTFKRHTLAGGFTPRIGGQGRGAPGSAITTYPNTKHKTGKPVILLSGDDDGRAYLVKAASSSGSDWKYTTETVLDVGRGTVGELAAQDVDGDGWVEVFIPGYDKGIVYAYTFKN